VPKVEGPKKRALNLLREEGGKKTCLGDCFKAGKYVYMYVCRGEPLILAEGHVC